MLKTLIQKLRIEKKSTRHGKFDKKIRLVYKIVRKSFWNWKNSRKICQIWINCSEARKTIFENWKKNPSKISLKFIV